MSRHVRRSYDHPLTLKLSDPPLKFCCVKLQKSFGRAFFFFSLSKRRPLQRCVSMPQTDMCWSTHTYQICFQIVPLHMRNSEYSSPSPSLRSCLLEGGARRQVCPRGFGAIFASAIGIRKAGLGLTSYTASLLGRERGEC